MFLYIIRTDYKKRKVDAIQMGTHNICLYKEVDKKYTGCHPKTMDLLDYALIGVCAVNDSSVKSLDHLTDNRN